MPNQSPLSRLLVQARARELAHLAFDKGALALTIILGGAAVLLLAGTDILNWYWLALLAVASLATGAHRLRKSVPSRYVLAQRIDRRLELADSLSTAVYFSENPRPDRAAVCERQRSNADTVAAQVDLKQAVPYTRSRYLAPAAACAAIAFGLFGVRYLVTGKMDLKASLARVVYDSFFGSKSTEARNQLPKRAKLDPQTGAPNQDTPSIEADRQPEDLLNSDEASDANDSGDDNSKTGSQQGSQKDSASKGGSDKGKQNDSGKGKESQDQNGKEGNDSKGANPNDAKQGGKPSGGDKNQSMLDKMKNALSDLADKIKQAAEGSKGDEAPPQNSDGQKPDDGQKGDQPKDPQSQPSANGQQQGQGQDQSGDSKNDQKASESSQGADSKSGIGAMDGQKAIKEAEQLQAMGKISEIIGKRSAAVSGEVMVEVGSGKQQLKTPWAQQQANHSNAGGEIHRDEIPLTEQPFVEKYFEEIHKAAPPAGKKDG